MTTAVDVCVPNLRQGLFLYSYSYEESHVTGHCRISRREHIAVALCTASRILDVTDWAVALEVFTKPTANRTYNMLVRYE